MKTFTINVKESLSDEEKETLFKAWLVVRSKKDMNLNFPLFLSTLGFEPLYALRKVESVAEGKE